MEDGELKRDNVLVDKSQGTISDPISNREFRINSKLIMAGICQMNNSTFNIKHSKLIQKMDLESFEIIKRLK